MEEQKMETRQTGLTTTHLKLIALVLMLLDHIHYFFEFTGVIPLWFTMAGRLAAPLFLFCTVEGFAHTHNRRVYFLRIYVIAAAMGALEFFMMYGGFLNRADGFYPLNGILLDFVLLCFIWQGIDWLKMPGWRRKLAGAALFLAPIVWPFVLVALYRMMPQSEMLLGFLGMSLLPAWNMITDGGWSYLIGGILLYFMRNNRPVQLTVWTVWTFLTEFVAIFMILRGSEGFVWTQMFTDYFEWFGVAAVLLMAQYNGKKGAGYKPLFYWFYPAHVYILYAISYLLIGRLHG